MTGTAARGAEPGVTAAKVPISIVIDDLGDRLQEGEAVVALPAAIGCAFLPESPHTRHLATLAHRGGKEIMLHLPMEPVGGHGHPLAISSQLPVANRTSQLERYLASVPYVSGVNNHQGSLTTSSRSTMHWLMRELSARGIRFFVDSMTSGSSVAYPMARAYGIPATRRKVFLDHERGVEISRGQFMKLVRMAHQTGGALAIGHPYPETLQVLREMLPRLSSLGVELVAPSQLIRRTEQRLLVQPVNLRMATALVRPAAAAAQPTPLPEAPPAAQPASQPAASIVPVALSASTAN
ncbi:MAG TPA: divergent polysaccharide deacetylase family protein [Fontimonas sp.]